MFRVVSILVVALTWAGVSWAEQPRVVATNADGEGAVLGNLLIYAVRSAEGPVQLWRSDGTAAGTAPLAAGIPQGASLGEVTRAANLVFFVADAGAPNRQLWRSDGTAAGTFSILDFPVNTPLDMEGTESALFFSVYEVDAYSLWRSDGTVAGTQRLTTGFRYAAAEFREAGGKVYFRGNDADHDEELWVTDGTQVGTRVVKEPIVGIGPLGARNVRTANGLCFFGADTSYLGDFRLWSTDGTEAGTQLIGPTITATGGGVAVGNALIFTGIDDAGWELWRSDGTAAGTSRLRDLIVGPELSAPSDFGGYRGLGYFTADQQPDVGTLFRSDGTASGTWPMAVAPPGPYPLFIGGARDEIYFQKGGDNTSIWGADRDLRGFRLRLQLPQDVYFRFVHIASDGVFAASIQYVGGPGDPFERKVWFIPADSVETDDDGDGLPNLVEGAEGRDAQLKDNDVFANARLFAMQQYRDFLGREGDAGGITFHTQNIVSGATTRPQVIESFLAAPEFQNGLPQVVRLYYSFFNRMPDFGGLMFHAAAYRSGAPLEGIAQNFSLSPEFTDRYGALNDEQYVDLVYQNVLGRPADPGGRQYYLERLGDGRLTRGQMMVGFSESPEFQQLVADEVYVIAVYAGMLRRAPEPAGLDFYVNLIENGLPRNAIIDGFLGAPEYRARFLPP